MRFYVAGKWENRQAVKELMNTLEEMGHEITCDWTVHKPDSSWPKLQARECKEGIDKCQEFIGLFDKPAPYLNSLVEFGMALGQNTPCHIIGDALNGQCMFLSRVSVLPYDTVEEFLEEIKEIYKIGG